MALSHNPFGRRVESGCGGGGGIGGWWGADRCTKHPPRLFPYMLFPNELFTRYKTGKGRRVTVMVCIVNSITDISHLGSLDCKQEKMRRGERMAGNMWVSSNVFLLRIVSHLDCCTSTSTLLNIHLLMER